MRRGIERERYRRRDRKRKQARLIRNCSLASSLHNIFLITSSLERV